MTASVPTPTEDLWEAYSLIYGFLNETLFKNTLPNCILNFATHGRSNAFFTPARWQQQRERHEAEWREGQGKKIAHELSLNPVLLDGPIEKVLAWIVRLMVQLHLYELGDYYDYQQGYYTAEFYDAMWAIGLPCSSDGTPTGKRTGYSMKHWIDPAGKFANAIKDIPQDYFPWSGDKRRPATGKKPLLYGCSVCGAKIKTPKPISGVCTTENCDQPFELLAS